MNKLKALLDEYYKWPTVYIFKFILPTEQVHALRSMINKEILFEEKLSKTKKYTSVTFHFHAESSEQIIDIYTEIKIIPGIMSL